ncbi:hypothetical protein INT45_001381 [Circinella minor]|uniref:Uncharacterized protein n=1 Tax=Circinella minor TaxID=1195481 RepID=A0A8H7RSU5_9FUNG|nr:hypothetical protein INT45_001381 [Circinella minor]
MNKRAFELANQVEYGDIKKVVSKMIDTLHFDIHDDISAACLPRYVIVAFIIQEAVLQLKSRYEIDDVDDGPADIFGYCGNVHSLNDFQESFPSALGTIIPYLLVHSWYPNSIFRQTTNTFPGNVFGVVDEAPILRGDSEFNKRITTEGIGEMEREATDVRNGNDNIDRVYYYK